MIDSDTPLFTRAAQLVVARLGSNMPPPVTVAEDAARVEALLERCPLGGLIVFNGTAGETPEVLRRLQAAAPVPLLIASDLERGAGQQLAGATVFPHARAFAALGDEAEAAVEAAARIVAREARACGVHVVLGPVADVNRERRNPIIATRAFSDDPATAARLVQAYVRGCRAGGALTTPKHFPGHGGTAQDSHEALPIVPDDRAVLEATDLAPFRAAIAAGAEGIMTAHVAFPALDASGTPATASPRILVELLRGELGFDGATFTDSLLMGAVRPAPGEEGRQAADLVAAGIDVLLDVPDPEAAVAGLVEAVETGRLAEARLDEAVGRMQALKRRVAEASPSEEVVGAEAHRAEAARIARRAVAVEGDGLPLTGDVLAIFVKPHRSRLDPPEQPLGAALREHFEHVTYREVGPETGPAGYAALHAEAGRARHVVVAVVVKPAAWHAFGLLPAQQAFVEALVARQPVVVAALGSPHVLDAFPRAALRLCTFSDVAASQQALAAVLAGR